MSDRDPNGTPALSQTGLDALGATVTAMGGAVGARGEEVAIPVGGDRFERGDEIGRGGMGVVFAATDRQFNRQVALKQLRGETTDAASVERFATECLITGNLEHPGIPAVYERGSNHGSPFYAMRHVRGQTLAEVLTAATSLEQRLRLVPMVGRVAQTLAYAHSHGVVHRDIKPSNIVVGDYGETFVLDWGIAKVRGIATDSSVSSSATERSVHSTRMGAVVGTPAYMAPEQAAGRVDSIDERTDVFALGALLYHLLVGHPPYSEGSPDEAIERARKCEFETVHQAARKAPKVLRSICERAMAERPADRFRSASDIATALDAFTNEAVAHQDSGPVGWIARMVTALTAVIALVGIGSVAVAVPTFPDAGFGAILAVILAAVGLSVSVLEYVTRGAYRLNAFILAIAGCTFIAGIVGTTSGMDLVYSAAAQTNDLDRVGGMLIEGTREAIGNITIAGSLTVSQLLAWAIARRHART